MLTSASSMRENSIKGPQVVDIDSWRLKVEGLVDTPREFTYEELLARDKAKAIGENHPKAGNNHYVPPYSLGAHVSNILPYFTEEH